MELEKFVTDWYTLFSSSEALYSLKNSVIYVSEYNLNRFKTRVNEIINNNNLSNSEKNFNLKLYAPLISFIRKNAREINGDFVQTEELEFVKENNNYIVIVKETKDISSSRKSGNLVSIDRAENDTIFISLFEEAQIITIRDNLERFVKENELEVFVTNIRL